MSASSTGVARPRTEYTPAQTALAALWWDLSGDFDEWLQGWMPGHIAAIRHLIDVEKIRLGRDLLDPLTVAYNRTRRPPDTQEAFTAKTVRDALPGAYIAKPFDEQQAFPYTDRAFLDWHLTSHAVSIDDLAQFYTEYLVPEGAVWFYGVAAEGQEQHIHALISFAQAHPMRWLLDMMQEAGLPVESFKLLPVHGSFKAAIRYLYRQATRCIEYGSVPQRSLVVAGNSVEVQRGAALSAIRRGESTQVLSREDLSRLHPATKKSVIQMWIAAVRNTGVQRQRREHRAESLEEARETAAEIARRVYSGRVFEIDFRQLLPGIVFNRNPPQRYFGEEVVLLYRVPTYNVDRQLQAPWLDVVGDVVYTVDENPMTSIFIPREPQPREEPREEPEPLRRVEGAPFIPEERRAPPPPRPRTRQTLLPWGEHQEQEDSEDPERSPDPPSLHTDDEDFLA